MDIRAPKSIVFGAERAEKSLYKRKIPCHISLGPSGRRFDPCHSDQNFDRKQSLFSTFGHFLCLFRCFTATFEKIFFRPHHQMWTENSFFFVYSGAKFENSNEQPPPIFLWRCCIRLKPSVQLLAVLSQPRFPHSFV